ncbi:hypothetical protein BHG98_19500 [Salmonella enterica]|nr:hypothetical protein [Salmonella enterica]
MNKFKIAMIAAVTMGSASVFAASGDPITHGSGNVNITGSVVASTCSLNVTGTDQTFTLTRGELSNTAPGTTVATAEAEFTLHNCNDTPLNVNVSGTSFLNDPFYGKFDNLNNGLRFQAVTEDNDGQWTSSTDGSAITGTIYWKMDGSKTLSRTPAGDSDSFKILTKVQRVGPTSSLSSIPDSLSARYTYNVTYK